MCVLNQIEPGVAPTVRRASGLVTSADRGARARTPAADGPSHEAGRLLLAELEHLRKRVGQQEHSLTVLTQAVLALRSGSQALQEENRELRLQLQKKPRSGPSKAEDGRR